jgi:hypothetical protein
MSDWFSSFAQQAMKLADDIADSLVTQANEAQSQLQSEQLKLQDEERKKKETLGGTHTLPWETNIESRQILSQSLMEKIFLLSLQERHFLERSLNADEIDFNFQEFVPVVLKLLQIDTNLARVHAKLSPKMNEETFWFNYYCRVMYLRALSGIDGPISQKDAEKYTKSDIIYESNTKTEGKTTHRVFKSLLTPCFGNLLSESNLKSETNKDNIPSSSTISSKPQDQETLEERNSPKRRESDTDDLDAEIEASIQDIELDELGDINPEDFEEIGSSECMDELEAQIAKELEEEKKKTHKK